jgi:ABC-type branched-subunit amino acid transport system substrate-binding protein
MIYCINPQCSQRQEPETASDCEACHTTLLINNRYRLVRPLRTLDKAHPYGEIFEVEDLEDDRTPKVLKVLKNNCPKLVELFKQEARLLIKLKHPGIPRPEEQFTLSLSNGQELHCLVMEKIEGQNLEQWLEKNGRISQELALDWLQQLAKILGFVHQEQLFHRDIKPSNIMRTPNGQLVLIDFGTAREVTQTVIDGQNVTVVYSQGYSAPEQLDGKAVPQSDFYALGRTFVHLLTGKHPNALPRNPQTDSLVWRRNEQQVSAPLADLIDQMMTRAWQKRPKNTEEILRRIKEIKQPVYRRCLIKLLKVGPVVIVVTSGIYGSYWYATGVDGCSKIGLRRFPLDDKLSCGEEILVSGVAEQNKQQGVNAFAAGDERKAVDLLEKAWQQRHDPETLIYLNNARLMNQKAYAIAVAAPLTNNKDMAQEILRGVAQAQNEINQGNKINGRGLKVLIADDENKPDQAKQIAEKLVSKRDILSVVGHFSSASSLKAMKVYQQRKLVMISPTSTSEDLSRFGKAPNHVFFRTVPSDRVTAQALANYLMNDAHQQKAAVFYNDLNPYSRSLHNQFHISFPAIRGQVIEEKFDLSDASFKAKADIHRAQKQGATALVLLPESKTDSNAFQNALKVIRANEGRYWMVGGDSLYNSEILEKEAVNRLVVATPWHSLSSPNPKFSEEAKSLWKGPVSWRTALAYDATRAVITALDKKQQPNRDAVRKALADPTFQANGATGEIRFDPSGDRVKPNIQLVKVVPSNNAYSGYIFVPVNSPTAQGGERTPVGFHQPTK